jgi:hypothetical protein
MSWFMLLGSLLALLLGAFPHPTAAMTWGDYSRRQNERGIQFYVAGVGAGFFYTNLYLNELGRAKVYCQPRSVNIPGVAYRSILNQYASSLSDQANGMSVEILLLAALSKAYPCR